MKASFDLYEKLADQLKVAEKLALVRVKRGEKMTNIDIEELVSLEQLITICAKDLVTTLMKKHNGRCYENTVIWDCD